jgi:hypothetical protein
MSAASAIFDAELCRCVLLLRAVAGRAPSLPSAGGGLDSKCFISPAFKQAIAISICPAHQNTTA